MQTVKLSVTVKRALECKYGRIKLKEIETARKAWIAADARRRIGPCMWKSTILH